MIRQTGGSAVGGISTRSSSAVFGPRQRFREGNNAELLTVATDQAHLGGGDFAVDSLMLVESYCLFSNDDKKRPGPDGRAWRFP